MKKFILPLVFICPFLVNTMFSQNNQAQPELKILGIVAEQAQSMFIVFNNDVEINNLNAGDFIVSGAASMPSVTSFGRVLGRDSNPLNTTILLNLSSDIVRGESITLTYAASGTSTGIMSMTGGTPLANFSRTVSNIVPAVPIISISPSTVTVKVGSPIEPINITSTGGSFTDYSIDPQLPAGLSFGTGFRGTRIIWGTPSEVTASKEYTITARNAGGEATASITINFVPDALVILGFVARSANEITIVLREPVTINKVEPADFVVSGVTSNPVVESVSLGNSGSDSPITVLLSLSDDIIRGENITLSYTRKTGHITNSAGGVLANFVEAVLNDVPELPGPELSGFVARSANKITIVLREPVTINNVEPADFVVSGVASNPIVESVLLDNSESDSPTTVLLLSLSDDIIRGENITLSYTRKTGHITNSAGGVLANFVEAVLNTVPELPGPELSGFVARSANEITIVLRESVTINNVEPADFVVSGVTSNPVVESVSLGNSESDSPTTVLLSLSDDIIRGENITLSYTRKTGHITNSAGGVLANFVEAAVLNDVPELPGPDLLGFVARSANEITIVLREPVTINKVEPADFVVSGVASDPVVESVSFGNSESDSPITVLLSLSDDIIRGENITLSYTRKTGHIINSAGGVLANFVEAVLNTVPEDSSLGNKDIEEIGFTISPNPTDGILSITVAEKADYRLFNIRGQTLKTGVLNTGKSEINLSSFAKGIYLLNIKTSKGSFTEKVIKN